MTFDEISKTGKWKPIRNCPGRYVLEDAPRSASITEVIGENLARSEYRVPSAPDVVVVVKLDSGGLISYKREDGSYLHTLNTPEGFRRKLLHLGIEAH